MIGLTKYLLLAHLRDRVSIFWMVLFPILLMIIFGSMTLGGSDAEIRVYGLALDDKGREILWLIDDSVDVVYVDHVDDPITFVVNATLHDLRPATLIIANATDVLIYSASSISAQIVSGLAIASSYEAYGITESPVNVTVKTVEEAESALGLGPTRVALSLALLIPIQAGLVGALSLIGALISGGIGKRVALSGTGRLRIMGAIAVAELVMSIVSTMVLLGIGSALFGIGADKLVRSWVFWSSFVVNYLLFIGLGLALSRVAVYAKTTTQVIINMGVSLFLLFAFLSGYFIPVETMSREMRALAESLPTYYTLIAAYGDVISGIAKPQLLAYPLAAAFASIVASSLLFTLHRRV